MIEVKFRRTYEYLSIVDDETGEIIETKCLGVVEDDNPKPAEEKKTTKKHSSKKKEESDSPQLILEENKCQLNNAAVQLTKLEPGDKISITYIQNNGGFIPVLVKDSKGNKITKSYTIAFRGSKRDSLSEYGTVFNIEADGDERFLLKGNKEKVDVTPVDVDLPELVEDIEDADIEEIDSNFFDLNI